MKNLAELAKLASHGKHMRRLVKNAGVALLVTTLSATTWAACSGVNLQVGYDFAFGAKTGIAALDAGTCVPNATTVNIPGNDYCSGAGGVGDYIIRTNDAGVATLKYTFTVGTVHTDYTVVVDIPQTGETGATSTRGAGLNIATFTGLPSACLTTGSPVSAITNGGRRLTCNIGTVDATNGQITVAIPAAFKASPRALNGETFALQSTESSAGGSTGACAAQPVVASQALTVSARPKIDIKTSIFQYSPLTYNGVQGYLLDYFVYVDGLNSATVGGEAIKSPLTFNIGLSSNVPTVGIQYLGVGDYYGATTDLATSSAVNSPAGNGILIPVTLTPNPAAPNCAAEFLVPGGACQELPTSNPERLSTHYIRYFVPLSTFPGAGQINFLNFINSDGSGAAGAIDTPAASTGQVGAFAEPITENSSPYTAQGTLTGSFAKYTAEFAETFTDRPAGSPGPNTAISSMNEPTFSWCTSGACKQYPGKNVESLIQFGNRSATPWTNTIICDKFDNRGMVLTRKPRSAGAAAHFFPTNMPGDTIVAQRTAATVGAIPSGYTVEVATAPGTPAAGSYPSDSLRCDDGSAAWVNANSVTNYAPYNMVRVKIPVHNGPFAANSDGYAYPVFFFTVPATAPNGAYIGNQALAKTDTEFNAWTTGNTGNFDPLTNSGVGIGQRFQVVKGLIRTTKDALDGLGNSTTVIGAGRTVTFKLSPSYTSAPGVTGPNANISVVDVLPSPLTYVPGSARTGSPVSTPFPPNSITVDGQGRQVLTWSLPNVALNSAISPIFIDVAAPLTAPAGTILTNTVTVADPSVDQSTDAERSAYKAVTTDNVAGFFVTKKVSVPLIPRNGTYFNTVEIANLKSTVENNIDVIDVLPRVADPRTPPSAFSGTRFLTGPVTPVLPTVATIYYTNVVVGAAPTALNSTIGGASAAAVAGDFAQPAPGPGWCTEAEVTASAAGCPAGFAAVTGFRAKIASIAGNGLAQLTVPMGTAGNLEDDKYTNRFAMAADGFGPLFSNDVVTTVKQAKISGKVYVDLDLNSQPGATEPPIPGVTVVLCNVATPIPCPTGNIVQTQVTGPTGAYEFTDLFPGTYFIRETQPSQYGSSGANVAGSAGGTASSPDTFDGVTLVVGQNGTNYNFGERANTLAGKVCEDLNNDGICQAGEPPIAGAVINLTGQDSLGNTVTRTATTNATGDWKMADLPNPNATGYTLTEIQPTAFLDGKQSPGVLTPASGSPDAGAAVGTTTPAVGNDVITGIKFTTATDGTNYDFGELKPASIQGFVYLDSNQDGVRQTTETPLLGVTVELKGTTIDGEAVTLVTTQSAGADGSYTFANLRPGTYEVREIQPSSPVFSGNDGTTTVGSIAYTIPLTSTPGVKITDTPSAVSGQGEGVSGITLGSGGVATGYNFGEIPTNSISGIVFLDKNYDGLPAGDTGLPNSGTTTLTLCLANENPCTPANTVATTTSAPGTGAYSFPSVTPGNYFVIETQPVGYGSSSPNAVPVTMANAPVTGINFAETGAVISGTVYTDVNGSGTLDPADVGLQGVTVRLCLDAACATVVSTTATGVNGTYTFADLPKPAPGTNYYVVETQSTVPPALVNGTTTVGSLTAAGTGGSTTAGTPNSPASNIGPINFDPPTSVVTGAPGVVGLNYNFGEIPTNSISGIVFLDKNYDGLPAGDTGLPNSGTTTLTLCLANENPCTPANTVATTTSAPGTGAYSFPSVTPGNYFVIETQPVGYGSSSPNAVPVTMANAPVTGINFAETGAVISGTVYTDVNGSGTLDPADVGLQGVTVRLCLDAACATVVSTTATGVNGTYTFADLPKPAPGTNYYVVETQSTVPPALVNGTTTVGSLTAAGTGGSTTAGTPNSPASNIGPINFDPPTSVVTGAPGVVGLNYNFGEVPVSSIAGTVFYDKNADGILTPGETGVGKTTTLVLCRSAAVPCAPADVAGTTITDGNGNYVFSQVPLGSYFIQEAQPEGYGSSTPNALPVVMTGTPITSQNFGETLANVSGTVYRDNDASGSLNAGDIGLANVTVRLCTTPACGPTDGPNGGAPLTVVTSEAGTYTFADLPAPPAGKSYFIVENQSTVLSNYPALQNGSTTVGVFAAAPGSTGVNNGVADSPGSTAQAINWTPALAASLTTAGTGTGYNFGELPTTQISGKVFIDKNFDGASNGTDSGLPGTTTVTLCRSNASPVCPPADVVATTVTTPGSGTYTFPTVTPGTYYAVETQPPGYGSSSPNTSPPIVVATSPVTGIDFAETGAYLSGTVYNDRNFNGALDSGTTDAVLPNVTVRLCTTANCTTIVATATTNPAGLYEFKDIAAPAPGQQYFIVEDQLTVPATFQNGTTTAGTLIPATGSSGGTTVAGTAVQGSSTVAGITWTPPTSVVAGTASVSGSNFNFGEVEGRDVSGKVYKDKARDGVLNPADDKPIADVVITLCRVATAPCPPTSVVGTTTTDINGDYKFTKVPQGQYFVQEAQPAGYGSSPSSPNVLPIQVAGAAVTDINFADTVSTIAGLIYRDSNNNGVKDASELPMPAGVVVTLTGTNAAGTAVTKTTTTAIDGSYKFEDLLTPNGAGYTITETQPAGFGTGAANPGTLAGGAGGTLTNVISGIQLPENTDAPNYNFGDVPKTAGISGTVWTDDNKDNKLSPGEKPASGWIVQLVKTNPADPNNPILVATSNETGSDGSYVITGVEPGAGYAVIFFGPKNPDGTRTRWGNPTNGEQGSAGPVVNADNGAVTNQPSTGVIDKNKPDSLSGITLYADAIVRQQSLPLDPSGVVYDAVTRQPVAGATVTLDTSSCTGFDANVHLVGGAANLTQVTGADGYYQYLLTPSAPACVYRLAVVPPAAYTPGVSTLIPPQPGAFTPASQPPEFSPIVPKSGAPGADDPTTYYLSFNLNPLTSSNVVNNNIPLDPKSQPKLFISKVVNKPTAELGDTVLYTVKVRNSGAGPTGNIQITDRLPAGFRYILGTSMLSASTDMAMTATPNPDGGVGSILTYNFVTPLAPGNELTLSYRVRLGVGSVQGDGINRAQARTGAIVSNEARAKVQVDPGVFTSESCVAGKVFVDCNNNHIQDAEEVGVPGVRLYLSDGTYFITDSEGKYSFCGLQPKSHVLSVDMLTMPRGSRMTTTSNRNLGDANSLFLDPKNGQLIRADFAEGSCSNTVLEQVSARRAKGEVSAPDTEKKGEPALKWEGKSPRYPQQGTNSADQILVTPRPSNGGVGSVPEQNTPVPQLPAASSNTRGANVRETK
jgi:uncharacterized repeat protein (TIGR01451 family)